MKASLRVLTYLPPLSYTTPHPCPLTPPHPLTLVQVSRSIAMWLPTQEGALHVHAHTPVSRTPPPLTLSLSLSSPVTRHS